MDAVVATKNMTLEQARPIFMRTIAAQIHLVALLAVVVLGEVLIHGHPPATADEKIVMWLYLSCSALLFLVSSTYHFWHDGFGMSERVAKYFEHLDHLTIYVFIASCYTALFYYTLDHVWGARLIVATWSYVAFGVTYTLFREYLPGFMKHRFVYTGSFVLLGWIVLFRAGAVLSALTYDQLWFFMLGGAAYTLGALVYALKWEWFRGKIFNYHEVWHLLVVVGWGCHFALIRLLTLGAN